MAGVTTAILAFLLLALLLPSLINDKRQYYFALFAVVAIIFLDAVAHMAAAAESIRVVCYVLAAFCQIAAIVFIYLATGGISFRELKGDVIEVVRRGETEKEIIIPLSEEAKQKMREAANANRPAPAPSAEPHVYKIDDPISPAPSSPSPPKPPSGPIPLD